MITNRIYSFLGILFGLLFVFNGNVWGTDAEWDWSTDNLSSTTKGQITMSYGNGGASTSTTVSGTPSTLRLYSNKTTGHGGWIKFTAASGYQITSVSVTAAENQSKARYGVDAANVNTAVTSSFSYSSGSATVSNLTASTFTIKNGHTGNNTATLRFSSITVTYSSTCDKSVTVSNGGSSANGSITSITTSPVATCSSTAADRRVSILVTPSTGYVAPTDLSVGSTTGTVNSSKVSRTDNGNGTFTFVYGYNQNDNGTISYNAACVGKQCTLIFNQNSGTGGQTSNLTATYGSAMPAISGVPTREHYDFEGYYDGAGGTGNKYYNSDGTSATNWNKNTTANTTLYAKWTEHSLTNYRTSCCTEMGTINNSLSLTQGGNSVTISGWTYNDASSTKPAESNLASYTVRMYKKNGASWDLVSGTATGGSAGTAGTRTGIATNSKSVTFTGLVVESEYKFTIEGIGAAGYCDIEETEITSINSTDVSSTPFKFRYSIYIDNGSGSGWAHHYIEPTGNTDEGSVSITLGAHVTSYQFKIFGGFAGDWGQTGSDGVIPANTKWTLNGSYNVKLNTGAGGAYVFTVDYSGTTNPGVTVTFPSADQAADYKIYFDKSAVADWGATLKYRIGNGSHNQNQNFTLVPGTDQFYVTTTPSYGSMDAWQIANNVAWSGSNSIYNYYHADDATNITRATVFQDYAVDEDITIVPTSVHNTENSCQFWDVSKTSGMLTHTATITTPSHGTINIAYTDVSGTSQSKTATTAGLAHRTILTITATPATGYTCTSLTVNGAAFTSGSTHILAADATIAATFTAQTSTVTLDNNSATSGSQQTVTATYDATMPLKTTADGTPAVAALTRTGYTFNGWWDNTSGGNQYYTYSGSPKVIASARTWDKTGAQTLKAQWIVNQYTLTWDLQGGTVATAGTGAAAAATGTPSSSQDYGTALTAPVVTKTGYNFNVWSPSVAGTMPAANTTYTASWTAQVYNITYKDQGDNAYSGNVTEGVPTGAPTTHTYGSATALVDGVKDGYRFDGWFTDASCTVSAGSSIGATAKTADFTLYAKWTQVYTVTWHVNGSEWSSGVEEGNTHVPGGSKVSALPTAPTSSDCDDAKVFVGWRATAIDGTSASNPGSIFTTQAGSPTISANTTFYAVFADVSARQTISLSFPDDNSANNGLTSNYYTSEWTAKAGTFSFTISNFNNNNWGGSWTNIRCGRNEIASTAYITTDAAISFRVDSVYVTVDAITATGVNAFKVQVANASTFATPAEVDITQSAAVQKIKIASPATGKYYRIVADCNNSVKSNGYVRISNVTFMQQADTANYVTSCSSCDDDATYTNTTPAVSEIGCTGATLTMEDGLATLGADGCHVSDYGFVIGTSDNPVIGGSGVTKLQVGTSDPTIGEDFSYDATGLTKGTHYYIRAYAINRHGTAYSSSQNFWTKDVSSIAITTAPTKTNYIVGETFDATGMVVTATMASGSTEAVTGDVTYSESALTAGASQNFPINYILCETEKSVNQVINVYTLTVTEGTNPEYGTATNSSANIVSITGLGDHKTYTVTVTSSNATAVDNGDNTWSIINPTGNVTVRVDYADAVQVKVYYKVDGVTVTGLTQDVYQSETTTLPTASELATAMTAQGMDIPDDDYPNFVGWSETEFSSQTSEPSLVTGTPVINAEKTYYAVYTNMGQIHLSADNLVTTYPSTEKTVNVGSTDFKYHYLGDANLSGTHVMQFKKHASEYGYIYNNDALSNILRIEIGYYNSDSHVPVYAASAEGTIAGGALTPASRETTDPYVYTFPASTSYFMVKGDNSSTYKISYIDIYYASSTVYYMTQFCTRYTITGASTSGTAVTGGTLTSSYNSTCEGKSLTLSAAVTDGYAFEGWTITGASSGDMTSTLLGANASSVTPPAFTMPAENITVSATITEKEVTGWTWKQELADASEITIPATVELYIGQQAKFNLKTYAPADVLAGKKGYSADYTGTDLAQDSKAGAYYVTRAKIAKESTTLTLTSTSNGSVQEVITIRIKELPLVHFVDIIHGETFADVVANVDASEKRTVYTTKPTPTHSAVDDPGGSYNTCERQHLHLIGWIESEWADAHPNAEPGDITGAGAGNYYAAGANIDLVAQNGKTFYAVWAKFE